jgi:hypothetical protein
LIDADGWLVFERIDPRRRFQGFARRTAPDDRTFMWDRRLPGQRF